MPTPVLVALLSAALAVLAGAGCREAPGLDVRPGTRLVYEVDYLGLDQYPFTVTVVERGPDLVLDYRLNHDSTSAWGRVRVTAAALAEGHRQHNFFATGRHDLTLRESTTVWLGRGVFDALRDGCPTPVNLGPDGDPDDTLRAAGRASVPVRIGPHRVDVPAVVGRTDRGQTVWVWDNPDDPVILKIDYGWTITIREAVSPEG